LAHQYADPFSLLREQQRTARDTHWRSQYETIVDKRQQEMAVFLVVDALLLFVIAGFR
jgi:hypothetical protein